MRFYNAGIVSFLLTGGQRAAASEFVTARIDTDWLHAC
jgi:hypothetical protein